MPQRSWHTAYGSTVRNRAGASDYIIMVRGAGDPEPERGSDEFEAVRKRWGVSPHLALAREPIERLQSAMLESLAENEPCTFNRVAVGAFGLTADIASTKRILDMWWQLVEVGIVEHTARSPVLWRLTRPGRDRSMPRMEHERPSLAERVRDAFLIELFAEAEDCPDEPIAAIVDRLSESCGDLRNPESFWSEVTLRQIQHAQRALEPSDAKPQRSARAPALPANDSVGLGMATSAPVASVLGWEGLIADMVKRGAPFATADAVGLPGAPSRATVIRRLSKRDDLRKEGKGPGTRWVPKGGAR